MPSRLRRLKIEEVSLVDYPANKGAMSVLHKRDANMKQQESALRSIAKMLGLEGLLKNEAPAGDPPASGGDGDGGTPASGDAGTTSTDGADNMAQNKDGQPAGAGANEELTKRLDEIAKQNEELRKANEEMVKEIRSFADLRKQAERLELAKSLVGRAPVKAEDVAKCLGQLDEEGQGVLKDLLGKLNGALKNPGALTSVGKADTDDEVVKSAAQKIEKATSDLMSADPKLTKEQAFLKAVTADPAAYAAMTGETA